jgi:hypothetical protein
MAETAVEPEQSQIERTYAVICLLSLLLVVILMMLDGMGVWSVLPMLVGGVAFLMRWRTGPPLVLFIFLWMAPTRYAGYLPESFLAAVAGWTEFGHARAFERSTNLEDILICAALLTYAVSCYRSLALSHSVFPQEYQRVVGFNAQQKQSGMPLKPLVPRPGEPFDPREMPILFGVLGGCLVLGFGIWALSWYLPPQLGRTQEEWRNIMFFWVLSLVLALVLAYFRYQARRRAPLEENLLYLQDQLWRQTRREQGTINRWLVWARQRWQRRKEQ